MPWNKMRQHSVAMMFFAGYSLELTTPTLESGIPAKKGGTPSEQRCQRALSFLMVPWRMGLN
jgi:hypothetical protein